MSSVYCFFFFSCYCDHRDLHVLPHSFPTRRSSDLLDAARAAGETPAPMAVNLLTHDSNPRFEPDFAIVRKWEPPVDREIGRSEEHTSELQSLMRISYAVFCLKKKIQHNLRNLLLLRKIDEYNNRRNETRRIH